MNRLYNNCLIEGSFNPPHMGHVKMIGHALAMADKVFIHVGMDDNHLLQYPTKKVLLLHNILYRYPSRVNDIILVENIDKGYANEEKDEYGTVISEEYWEKYLLGIEQKVFDGVFPVFDCVVSSDRYGARIAEELGAEWVPYDIDRRITPISSTKVRREIEQPGAFGSGWDHFLPEIRLAGSRLAIVNGVEGSGKTSLCEYLGYKLLPRPTVLSEYGRHYTLEKERTNPNYQFTLNDFKHIALAQHNAILEAKRDTQTGFVLSDTDALTTYLFAKHFLTPEDTQEFEEWCRPVIDAQLRQTDLYVLTSLSFYHDNDGTRTLTENERKEFFSRMTDYLSDYNNLPVAFLPNPTTSDTNAHAVNAFTKMLQKSGGVKRKFGDQASV